MDSNFLKCKNLNYDMWDANRNLLSYLIQVYKRNGITQEEYENAKVLLSRVSKALAKVNGKVDQPTGNTNFSNRRGNSTLFWVLSRYGDMNEIILPVKDRDIITQ